MSPPTVEMATGSKIRKCTGWKKKGTVPLRTIATVTTKPEMTIATIHPAATQPSILCRSILLAAMRLFWVR